MKRSAMLVGLLLVVGMTTAAAQTRVTVSIAFGVPALYAPRIVVVERPFFSRPPMVVVVRRPYHVRRGFVERVVFRHDRYHYHHRPYHRVRACGHHRCGH